MTYLGEERAKFKRQQSKEAIALAIQGRWQEAAALNRAIIENSPGDVEARNRLGRALTELGEYAQAREAYLQTTKVDPNNRIAQKNLDRLSLLEEETTIVDVPHQITPQIFLEETGKTGVVNLINLAPATVLARMGSGEGVNLKVESKRLLIEDRGGEYLGEVDHKYAPRLLRLMEGGNEYTAAIASLDNGLRVLIRETYQHPSQEGRLSFPLKAKDKFRSYLRDSLLKHEDEEAEEESAEAFIEEETDAGYQ